MNISVPAFKEIFENTWDDKSFIGHSENDQQKGCYTEIKNKNTPFVPEFLQKTTWNHFIKRAMVSNELTGSAVLKIHEALKAALQQKTWERYPEINIHKNLAKFDAFYQERHGLFTKAEFKEFCDQHRITIPPKEKEIK